MFIADANKDTEQAYSVVRTDELLELLQAHLMYLKGILNNPFINMAKESHIAKVYMIDKIMKIEEKVSILEDRLKRSKDGKGQ